MGKGIRRLSRVGWVSPPPGWLGAAQAALSHRTGGVSPPPFDSLNLGRSVSDLHDLVLENERRFHDALALPGRPARTRLEHGVQSITVYTPGDYGPADSIMTDRPGLPLWLTVADCLPVFFSSGRVIGLLHGGWRSVAAGGGRITVEAIERLSGLPAGSVRVWIGPGIGPCCYPVRTEVASHFPAEALRETDGRTFLDLRLAVRRQLIEAKVPAGAIRSSRLCTSCRSDLFFSYRRDGVRSGRMAAVIWHQTATGPPDQARVFR